jgi:hypothetical protein
VPEEKETRRASRYDAIIATFVGFLALCVSGYTAYMQRQQVRAAVWPILEFGYSNHPDIHFTLANKGVGPAIIRHVVVKVDGQPVVDWVEALRKLVGSREPRYSESDMSGRVLAADESLTIFTPHGPENNPNPLRQVQPALRADEQGPRKNRGRNLLLLYAWRMLDIARRRVDTQHHHHRDPSLPDSVGN